VSIAEHSIASLTCLHSGLQIFSDEVANHTKNLRTVAGLHSFHLYAAENWVEQLFVATSTIPKPGITRVHNLAIALAESAERLEKQLSRDEVETNSEMDDERSAMLPYHPHLQRLLNDSLKASSLKVFESRFRPVQGEFLKYPKTFLAKHVLMRVKRENQITEVDTNIGMSCQRLLRFTKKP
jgi:hypothetical protein